MNDIKTIIVDDHAAFRRSLMEFLQTRERVEVVGQAADGRQALELLIELCPRLVLMDICMPNLNGADSCREMKRLPNLRCLTRGFLLKAT